MKRALLAEDDPASRIFLTEALRMSGWQCEAHVSGEDAAAAAIAQPFDVLLLDLNLPGIDGVQTLRRIRNLDSHASADVPALALTADDRPHVHQDLERQGFEAVVSKPVSVAQLAQALARLGFASTPGTSPKTTGAAQANDTPAPIWDDTTALAAVGGDREILHALRQLMLADLPAQRDAIIAGRDTAAARTALHRLRAACGFCGAARLAHAVITLERLPATAAFDTALDAFVRAANQTLSTPAGSHVSGPNLAGAKTTT